MLLELSIKDFAIINSLNISFSSGFSVFTGETGAGKSIIIGALDLILGKRASADTIRSGRDEAVVSALFDVSANFSVVKALKDCGLDCADEVLVRRVVNRSGRNKVYINGSLATLSTLSKLSGVLVDICSQSEHQSLASSTAYIDYLDRYADLKTLNDQMRKAYEKYRALGHELDVIKKRMEFASRERELKEFQSREIAGAALSVEEASELVIERDRLKNSEKLADEAHSAERILYSEQGSVIERLGAVISGLKEVSCYDSSLEDSLKGLDDAYYALEDVSAFLRDYGSNLPSDALRLEAVEDRLDLIATLKRKYSADIPTLIARGAELEAELEEIGTYSARFDEFNIAHESARTDALTVALALSAERKKSALALKEAVEAELKSLVMEGCVFEVDIRATLDADGSPVFSENGADEVGFLISTNPGEGLKPMEVIASGGELSRIMLALKKAVSFGKVATLVFDEVDTGVGATVARRIAVKLKELSRTNQVICITHMPQIAVYADAHYRVYKGAGEDDRTVTGVERLDDGSLQHTEITRMLGGSGQERGNGAAIEHAKELLSAAKQKDD